MNEVVVKKQNSEGLILQRELDLIISKFTIIHTPRRIMNIPEIENDISKIKKLDVVDLPVEKNRKSKKGEMGKKNLVIKDAEILSKAKIERTKYSAPEFLKLDDNSISLAKGERERLYHQNLCISIFEYNLSS